MGLGRRDDLDIFLHQRHNAYRGVVLQDQLALGRYLLHLRKDYVGAVTHLLDLVPLRRIRDRHPQHGLIALHAVKWQAQIITAHRQHRPGPGAVFLLASRTWQWRSENLTTR